MTAAIGIGMLLASALPLGVLVGFLHNDTKWTRHQREMARLTAPLPAVRDELTEPAVRVRGATITAHMGPAVDVQADALPLEALSRFAEGLRNLDSERVNNEYPGRHRYGVAVGSSAQMAGVRALREPTGEFQTLVSANWDTGEREALVWRCDVCRGVVADGERPHDHCEGCGCPCRLPALIGRPPLVGAR
jgi:hypothetical protein